MPPVLLWALAAMGTTLALKVLAKEGRRVNAELDALKKSESAQEDAFSKLRRDPETGIYHPK